jgi:thiamine-phosphate pyrophosphorylase
VARLPERRPLLYYITDRKALPGQNPLPLIEAAVRAGVDLIQIRERDLPTRELLALVERALALAAKTPTRVLVNDRLDIAQVAGAGLHLPAHSFPVAAVRRRVGRGLLIGASTHNLDELQAAEQGGADFAVFGPVFATASKPGATPVGLEKLSEAVRAVRIPVLALGGVTLENAADCLRAGAAGLAAISLFQTSPDLPALVASLRALRREGTPSGVP